MNRLNSTVAKPHLVSLAVLSAIGNLRPAAEAHSVHDLKTEEPGAISKIIDRQSNLVGTVTGTMNAARSTVPTNLKDKFRQPDQGMAGLLVGHTIYSEDPRRSMSHKQRSCGIH